MRENTFEFITFEQAKQFVEEGRNYLFQYDCDFETIVYLVDNYELKRVFQKNVYSKKFVDTYIVPWFPHDNVDHRMDLCDVYKKNTSNSHRYKNTYYTLDRVQQIIGYMDKQWLLSLDLDFETKQYIQNQMNPEDQERYIYTEQEEKQLYAR